jgi:hypothetical protein
MLNDLGASQDMQILNDSTPPKVEEIFAESAITGTSSLPLAHMSQGMLDSHSFAQFTPSLRGLLASA